MKPIMAAQFPGNIATVSGITAVPVTAPDRQQLCSDHTLRNVYHKFRHRNWRKRDFNLSTFSNLGATTATNGGTTGQNVLSVTSPGGTPPATVAPGIGTLAPYDRGHSAPCSRTTVTAAVPGGL